MIVASKKQLVGGYAPSVLAKTRYTAQK